jgi:uncharacterized membrane protein (UPF0182 family)
MPQRSAAPPRFVLVVAAVLLLLLFSRSICGLIIDYEWWKEMGQVSTWLRMSAYRYLPDLIGWALAFALFWITHARGMRFADAHLRDHRIYAWISTAGLAVLALIVSGAAIDGWTAARYAGGAGITTGWRDPVFDRPLAFYFFELPFYSMLLHYLLAVTLVASIVYYATARGWQLARRFPGIGSASELDIRELRVLGSLETLLFKSLIVLFLVALAVNFWLGRYRLLFSDHGNLMTGIDYVQQHYVLPLTTADAIAALVAAALVIIGRRKLALACALILVVDIALPGLVSSIYVRPNELALEKPFLERHIEATRSAYGLDRRAREVDFPAEKDGRIDLTRNRALLDNVRLWDWRPFHDTLSQNQPLRPYTYVDTDVDRYTIDGKLRQVLLSPREPDLDQLGAARSRWINYALTFTHGYGLVLAEANRITETGLPELLVKSAPIEVLNPSLKVARPEIYYGETLHEPVFVHTAQAEFNYPKLGGSGEENTRYQGRGGFPVGSFGMRLAAAVSEWEWNILLTNSLTSESRMMIHRRVTDRLSTLASFISWEKDPYLVVPESGQPTWVVDGYLTSESHPYSRESNAEGLGTFNYIRNSVKATIDAYDGVVHFYIFDPEDPLVTAYAKLFPTLFEPASAMPAGLRVHTRSPEMQFEAQAEIYRTYHMRDPELYYNRADLWDLTTFTSGQNNQPQPAAPTYIMAALPGETQPEFLLTIPFTPRGKQNLIGMMVARCDGEHLGEIVYMQLPKQEVISGPLQIEALINQDSNISKDLTLWNQQGSQVLRSQVLILPVDNTFLYVAPIYLQAAQARMPQLRKIVLAVGNTLVYADTYQQALADLDAAMKGRPRPAATTSTSTSTTQTTPSPPPTPSAAPPGSDARIATIRQHLERYRTLAAQGKWSEAGKELEAVEALVRK